MPFPGFYLTSLPSNSVTVNSLFTKEQPPSTYQHPNPNDPHALNYRCLIFSRRLTKGLLILVRHCSSMPSRVSSGRTSNKKLTKGAKKIIRAEFSRRS